MALSEQVLEQLLYEDEGSTLDFKRDQYPFEGASNDAKSELLKDILAFANAWRRSDACVLIGVEEVRGGRSTVVGVAEHLDDAKLQQFVNAKTQRPLHFSYQQARLDDQDIGVLYIQPQERPIYLVKPFGKLEKQTVYIRRNSSTDVAAPDEIAKMGQAVADHSSSVPLLELQFFDPVARVPLGESIEAATVIIDLPKGDEIPDYGRISLPAALGGGTSAIAARLGKNLDYYRDAAIHLKNTMETTRFEILAHNAGSILAQDVRVEFVINESDDNLIVRDSSDRPKEPLSTLLFHQVELPELDSDVKVQRSSQGWIVTANLGKIQPKASAHTMGGLFMGARHPAKIDIKAMIFADNLPAPQECNLSVNLKPRNESCSVQKLVEVFDRMALNDLS